MPNTYFKSILSISEYNYNKAVLPCGRYSKYHNWFNENNKNSHYEFKIIFICLKLLVIIR